MTDYQNLKCMLTTFHNDGAVSVSGRPPAPLQLLPVPRPPPGVEVPISVGQRPDWVEKDGDRPLVLLVEEQGGPEQWLLSQPLNP